MTERVGENFSASTEIGPDFKLEISANQSFSFDTSPEFERTTGTELGKEVIITETKRYAAMVEVPPHSAVKAEAWYFRLPVRQAKWTYIDGSESPLRRSPLSRRPRPTLIKTFPADGYFERVDGSRLEFITFYIPLNNDNDNQHGKTPGLPDSDGKLTIIKLQDDELGDNVPKIDAPQVSLRACKESALSSTLLRSIERSVVIRPRDSFGTSSAIII